MQDTAGGGAPNSCSVGSTGGGSAVCVAGGGSGMAVTGGGSGPIDTGGGSEFTAIPLVGERVMTQRHSKEKRWSPAIPTTHSLLMTEGVFPSVAMASETNKDAADVNNLASEEGCGGSTHHPGPPSSEAG
jgi:hypothetical protein